MHTTTIGPDGHRYRTPFSSTPTRAIEVSYYTMTRQERAGILCVGLLALGVVALTPAARAADSGLARLEGLREKTLSFVDPASSSGYISPMVLLVQRGLVRTRDPKTFFREVVFSGAHEASMRALLNGHVDAIASFDLAREQYLADPVERERVTWVAETEHIPEAGIAARAGLDPAAFARIRAALLQIHGPAYAPLLRRLYEIDGFAPADDHDYDPVRAAMELLGVRPR